MPVQRPDLQATLNGLADSRESSMVLIEITKRDDHWFAEDWSRLRNVGAGASKEAILLCLIATLENAARHAHAELARLRKETT